MSRPVVFAGASERYWLGRVFLAIADLVDRGDAEVYCAAVYRIDPRYMEESARLRKAVNSCAFRELARRGLLLATPGQIKARLGRRPGYETIWRVLPQLRTSVLREEAMRLMADTWQPCPGPVQHGLPFTEDKREVS